MMGLLHGGDIAGYRMEYGAEPLEFSANVNPLGLPPGVREAMIRALDQADRYPDPLCRELGAAIAAKHGLPQDWVLCGNGAADLIFRLALAARPRRALLMAPTFAEYELALELVGCEPVRYALDPEREFAPDEGFLDAIAGVDLVFLCCPNNPTGQVMEPDLLMRAALRCQEIGALLVLDECFNGFLDQPGRYTMTRRLGRLPGMLILQAFTKLYGMAGVRLGYCLCADRGLLERMRMAGQPWEVSSLAQAAGVAALAEDEYLARTRELVRAGRDYLWRELCALGQRVMGSQANYMFFRTDVPDLPGRLRQKGILLRGCGNYHNLDASYCRAAVRGHEENQQLIAAIRAVREEG